MQSNTRVLSIFVLTLLGLFSLELFQPVQLAFIQPFTVGIAKVSSWVILLFDSEVVAQGIIIRDLETGLAIAIQAGCNGVEAMICLTAAILAFPSPWENKFWGLLLGFLAIQALNIVRIISLFYLLLWDQKIFEWAHLYLWQALIILDAFFVFIIWLRYLPKVSSDSACVTN